MTFKQISLRRGGAVFSGFEQVFPGSGGTLGFEVVFLGSGVRMNHN